MPSTRPWLFSQRVPDIRIAETVDLAAEAGCGLLIRAGHEWGDPANSLKNPAERVQDLAAACKRRQVPAGLWAWPHPDHLAAHFKAIADAIQGWKPEIIVSDVEHSSHSPWGTHPDKELRAERLISGHRERGHVPHVVTSYGAVHYHRRMPWLHLLPPGVPFMGQWQTVDLATMERSKKELRVILGREPVIMSCGGLHKKQGSPDLKSEAELREHKADHYQAFGGVAAYWTLELLRKRESLAAVMREGPGVCGPA